MDKLFYDKMVDHDFDGLRFHYIFHDYVSYHTHDFWEFMVCTSGKYSHLLNGVPLEVNAYEGYLLNPEDCHNLKNLSPESSHFDIMISEDKMKRIADSISSTCYDDLRKRTKKNFILSSQKTNEFTQYLLTLQNATDPKVIEKISSFLVFNILEVVFSDGLKGENNKPEWLKNLLIKINNPANAEWNVEDAVNYTHFSHGHLSRLFKQEMGVTLIDYMAKQKMNYARDLLLYSDLSVAEIAANLGLFSPSYFNNAFKKHYGMAPGKYRELYAGKKKADKENGNID